MDWNDTPEQSAFRDEVRQYIQSALPQYYKDQIANRHSQENPEAGWQFDMMHGGDAA